MSPIARPHGRGRIRPTPLCTWGEVGNFQVQECTAGADDGPQPRPRYAHGYNTRPAALLIRLAYLRRCQPWLTAPSPPRAAISARIGGIAESATLAVDAKAKALKAAGRPVIGFGAGEPDFPTPPAIVEAAAEAARDPRNHRYTPAAGLPELREAVAAKTLRDSGYEVTASQVLVTNGGKQAVYQAFATLIDPGDEVLLPAPYWTTYPEAIALAGGVAVPVLTDESSGYLASVEQLEAARTPRTKALLFCSPSNPTGAVYPREQVEAIGRWAVEHGIWVITDEIYEHLTYDGVRGRVDAGRRAGAGRHLHRGQRRRQDLRDDRLAGGLADRPGRRHEGGREPAVAPDVERRRTCRSARRSPRCRAAGRGARDAGRRSTAGAARS